VHSRNIVTEDHQ